MIAGMNESPRKIRDSWIFSRQEFRLNYKQSLRSCMKKIFENARDREINNLAFRSRLVSGWSLQTRQRKFCHRCDRTETTLQRQRRWDSDYIVNIEKVVALRSTQLFLERSQRLYTLSFIRIMFIFSAEVEYCYFPVDFGLKIFSWVFSEIKACDIFLFSNVLGVWIELM